MAVLTVIAGPNGSGKSTLTDKLIGQGASLGEYLNADDIARGLEGALEEVSARAQQIVRDKRDAALHQQRDHAFETVMSHPSHIDHMAKAEAMGFEVRLYFVATEDPSINLARVANRVFHGGHPVPSDRVVGRYHRCLRNLPGAIRTADVSAIFDNSSADRPLRLLARIQRLAGRAFLTHGDIAVQGNGKVDPNDIPVWWLEILLQIKRDDTFDIGFIS